MEFLVIGYNRPKYLYVALDALFRVRGIEKYSVYVYIDGEGGCEKEIEEVIQEFPVSDCIIRRKNLGILKHITYSLKALFDKGIEEIVYLGEDSLLTPDTIEFLKKVPRDCFFVSLSPFFNTELPDETNIEPNKQCACYPGRFPNLIMRDNFAKLFKYIENKKYVGKERPGFEGQILDENWTNQDAVYYRYLVDANKQTRFADKSYAAHFGISGQNALMLDGVMENVERQMFASDDRRSWLYNVVGLLEGGYKRDHPKLNERLIPKGFQYGEMDTIKRILFVIPVGIGNMVMLTPTLRAVREMLPSVEINVLCKYPAAEVLEGWGNINILTKPDNKHYEHIFSTFHKCDWDQQIKSRCNYWHKLTRSPDQHEADAHFEAARILGYKGNMPETFCMTKEVSFSPSPSHGFLTHTFKPRIAISIGAFDEYWKWKKWPYFKELISILPTLDYDVVLVGGEKEAKEVQLNDWPKEIINCLGQYSLSETAYIISKCDVMIANDSGLAHIAAALGIRTLAIFGPTLVAKNRPLGTKVKIISAFPYCLCQDTKRWGTCKDPLCMTTLTVGTVIREIGDFLPQMQEKDMSNVVSTYPTTYPVLVEESSRSKNRRYELDLAVRLGKSINVQVCLEVGTQFGRATKVLADHFAKVYTIDIETSKPIHDPEGKIVKHVDIGYLHKKCSNVVQIIGDSMLDATWDQVDSTIGLAYIDGDHHAKYASNDTIRAYNKMKKGVIIWEGYCGQRPGIVQSINEFAQQHDLKICRVGNLAWTFVGQNADRDKEIECGSSAKSMAILNKKAASFMTTDLLRRSELLSSIPNNVQFIEGFSRVIKAYDNPIRTGQLSPGADYRGDSDGWRSAPYWAGGNNTPVVWETAVVSSTGPVVFAFTASSINTPPYYYPAPSATLSINGVPIIDFGLGVRTRKLWRSGNYALEFFPKRVQMFTDGYTRWRYNMDGNSGIYLLYVPAGVLKPACRAQISAQVSDAARNEAHQFFMIMNRENTLETNTKTVAQEIFQLQQDLVQMKRSIAGLSRRAYPEYWPNLLPSESTILYTNDYAHICTPDILLTNSGKYLLMVREGLEHGGAGAAVKQGLDPDKHIDIPPMGIACLESYDPLHFDISTRQILKPNSSASDPTLTQLSDNTILIIWHEYAPNRVSVARFYDEDQTFSEPIHIEPNVLNCNKTIEISNGELLAPWDSDHVPNLFISEDKGNSWRLLYSWPRINSLFPSTSVVQSLSGQLVAVQRYKFDYLHISYSNDNGRTWSEPKRTPMFAHHHRGRLTVLKTGEILCSFGWRCRGSDFPDQQAQDDLSTIQVAISFDEGQTWPKEYMRFIRNDIVSWDMGYPDTIELPDGKLYTYYWTNHFGHYFIMGHTYDKWWTI